MFRGIKEFTLETEHQRECSLKVRTFSGSFVRNSKYPILFPGMTILMRSPVIYTVMSDTNI